MNKIHLLSVLVFMIVVVPAHTFAVEQSASSDYKVGAYDPAGEVISIKAKGLVCEFCAKALEKVFMRRDEVAAIDVNLTTKEIRINLKEGKTIDDETVSQLIKDAGYNIGEITRSIKG